MNEQKPTAEASRVVEEICEGFIHRQTSAWKHVIPEISIALAIRDSKIERLKLECDRLDSENQKQRALLAEARLLLKGNQKYLDSAKVDEFPSRSGMVELLKTSEEGEQV